MRYPYSCPEHGVFEISRSIHDDIPPSELCPTCKTESNRVYEAKAVIYYGRGFHKTDYFDKPVGRGQSMDRKEWLNSNWSKHYGEEPPPASGGKE